MKNGGRERIRSPRQTTLKHAHDLVNTDCAMQSPFRADCLNGKVALVTGGGSGIGFQITRQIGETECVLRAYCCRLRRIN